MESYSKCACAAVIDVKVHTYVPETEGGVLPKPLTNLHDPEAMKMSYPDIF